MTDPEDTVGFDPFQPLPPGNDPDPVWESDAVRLHGLSAPIRWAYNTLSFLTRRQIYVRKCPGRTCTPCRVRPSNPAGNTAIPLTAVFRRHPADRLLILVTRVRDRLSHTDRPRF